MSNNCIAVFSNTGIPAGMAAHEALKKIGLGKTAVGCLVGLALELPSVKKKTEAAQRIMTVDCCPMECARKTVEKAGYAVSTAISLVSDFSIKKVSLDKDLAATPKPVLDYISQVDLDRAKMAIVSPVVRKG